LGRERDGADGRPARESRTRIIYTEEELRHPSTSRAAAAVHEDQQRMIDRVSIPPSAEVREAMVPRMSVRDCR
jgi:CBS domain containing-hemolysin-like protein